MNKAVMSVLCGSGALSFGLLAASAAQAEALVTPTPAPQYEETLVTLNENAVQADAPALTPAINYAVQRSVGWGALGLDPSGDTVGDAAIALRGCDCPGCRNVALQAIQTGQSTLGR